MGIVVTYCLLGALGRQPRDTELSSILIPIAVVLVGGGIVLSLPLLSRSLARRMARSTESLSLGLAMRRNEAESGGVLRVATSLVLLIFSASLVQGVLVELAQVSKNTSPVQLYQISLDGVSNQKQRAWEQVKGVRAHAVVMDSWRDLGADQPQGMVSAVVATCNQLRAIVVRADGCVDGRAVRLMDPNQSYDETDKPGMVFPFHVLREKQSRVVHLTLPAKQLWYRDYPGLPSLHSGDVLLPPNALPSGFRPARATLVLLSSSAPETVRSVLDGIAGVDPTTAVDTPGIVITSLQQITVIKTLLAVGMVLGLVIGVVAYLVAATDRAMERRAQVTALTLLGAKVRTLQAVQVAQVVLPLCIGLVLAVVTGKMTESSYLVTGGGETFWDGDGLPLLLGAAVGVVVVAALGSLPLVGRRIDPELIRRD
ncbi:ABC transporter permease [Streptomyces sp. NBC_00425]|uniref:ABC transporter permease n=1 Tax=Streptomyces sp. NBC_00425 TaxID=2975740 RepID=UPI002E1E5A21